MVKCLCGESPDNINKPIKCSHQKLITPTNTALLQRNTKDRKYYGSCFDQGHVIFSIVKKGIIKLRSLYKKCDLIYRGRNAK